MNRNNDREAASEEFSTAAELASYVENNTRNENEELHRHAGKVPLNKSGLFSFMESVYTSEHPDMPYNFYDTKLGKMMLMHHASTRASVAISEGNISQMKYFSGKQDYSADLSGYPTLKKLEKMLDSDAYIQYLFGHMGNGKTDFAILEAEILKLKHGYEIGTNIKSLDEKDEYIYSYGDLLQWLANGEKVGSVDEIARMDIDVGNKIIIFDEASSHASGYSQDAHETQKKLGTLVKKIRKVGGNLIIIGHTGKDVHPDIRRIVNHAVEKTGLKSAKVGTSVENAEVQNEIQMSPLGGIPPTNFNSYDTNEITAWDWSKTTSDELDATTEKLEESRNQDTQQRNVEIALAYAENEHEHIEPNGNGEITTQMLADHYGITKGRISQILSEVENMAKEANA
jgi:hypothetical protein